MSKKKAPKAVVEKFDDIDQYLIELGDVLTSHRNTIIAPEPVLVKVQAICDNFRQFQENFTLLFIFGAQESFGPAGGFYISPALAEQIACLQYAYNEGFRTNFSFSPMPENDAAKLFSLIAPYITDGIFVG
jgi:hypothetical protein